MSGGQKGITGGATIHGEGGGKGRPRSKEFRTWLSMRRRCKDKDHYVKHGITVCARWESSFPDFLADVGRAPSEKHTLDRFPNPLGNYEPGNVRWATMVEQRHNRRPHQPSRHWKGKKRVVVRDEHGNFVKLGGAM